MCKFSQNPPIGPGDRVQKMSNADADADANKFDILKKMLVYLENEIKVTKI